jgi:hypothetical protein
MIGTGIFTTLGFQLSDITNTYSIFLLWIIGGILALFGAFAMPNWVPILKETEAILFILKKPIIHFRISDKLDFPHYRIFITCCTGSPGYVEISFCI